MITPQPLDTDVNSATSYRIAQGWSLDYVSTPYQVILRKRGLTGGANTACIVADVLTLGGFIFIHAILWFASTQKMQIWKDTNGVHTQKV